MVKEKTNWTGIFVGVENGRGGESESQRRGRSKPET